MNLRLHYLSGFQNWWKKKKNETEGRRETVRKTLEKQPMETDKVPNVFLLDISIGGVCFLSDEHLELGSTVTLGGEDFHVRASVLDCAHAPEAKPNAPSYRVRCKFLSQQDKAQVASMLIQVLDEESEELFV